MNLLLLEPDEIFPGELFSTRKTSIKVNQRFWRHMSRQNVVGNLPSSSLPWRTVRQPVSRLCF